MRFLLVVSSVLIVMLVSNCSLGGGSYNVPAPSMVGPTVSERNAKIAQEDSGDHYIGRRYYMRNTRFWGYLRRPQQPWSSAKLVMFNEWQKKAPDRLKESAPNAYGRDSNYEYKIYGHYTGEKVYEPNSNKFLPEFQLKDYQLIDKNPGWIFSPTDQYDTYRLTLTP